LWTTIGGLRGKTVRPSASLPWGEGRAAYPSARTNSSSSSPSHRRQRRSPGKARAVPAAAERFFPSSGGAPWSLMISDSGAGLRAAQRWAASWMARAAGWWLGGTLPTQIRGLWGPSGLGRPSPGISRLLLVGGEVARVVVSWGGGACPASSKRGLHEHGIGRSELGQAKRAWCSP
jgi:hypothetical protein